MWRRMSGKGTWSAMPDITGHFPGSSKQAYGVNPPLGCGKIIDLCLLKSVV